MKVSKKREVGQMLCFIDDMRKYAKEEIEFEIGDNIVNLNTDKIKQLFKFRDSLEGAFNASASLVKIYNDEEAVS